MKAHMAIMREVDSANFGVENRALTCFRLNFSSLRCTAAEVDVRCATPGGSQALKSSIDTVNHQQKLSRLIMKLTIRSLPIPPSDLMNNLHSFIIQTFAHQIFRRLINREEQKTNKEFDHRYAPHNDDEISPAHVHSFRAFYTFLACMIA